MIKNHIKTFSLLKIIILIFLCIFFACFYVYGGGYIKSEQILSSTRSINNQLNSTITKKKNYVFFDLGTNTGNSVYDFFGYSKKYPQILERQVIENNEWIVYAFEANPLFNDLLEEMKLNLSTKHIINLYKETAAWIYNGNITFYLDTVNKKNDFWGSSLIKDHPDVIKSNLTSKKVKCVDIAELVAKYDEGDLIVMKIDIEGSEYEFLIHLILKNVLSLIDFMAIEYHENVENNFNSAKKVLNSIIKLSNINLIKWI